MFSLRSITNSKKNRSLTPMAYLRSDAINIFFDWEVSDVSGWGIYGFNLLYWTLRNPKYKAVPLPTNWPSKFLYLIDPLTNKSLKDAEVAWTGLKAKDGDFLLSSSVEKARRSIAEKCQQWSVIFFEANPLERNQVENIKTFDGVIVGSSWNKDALLQMGVDSRLVIQGVDTDLFRPLAKQLFKNRFVVFSGGKLEFRKGQDLVLRAFSIFSKTHRDALLITAWRTPYDPFVSGINFSKVCEPLRPEQDMRRAIDNWVHTNGVEQDQFFNLDSIPNRMMPDILREVDLAIFPNRCEGGTNLVAMEALSSGVKCAISSNTGHLDIITPSNCIALKDQKPVHPPPGLSVQGWGESNVDEIVAAMEDAYAGRASLTPETVRGSVAHRSWGMAINNLLQELDAAH